MNAQWFEEIQQAVENWARSRPEVLVVLLFGSRVKNRQRKRSDTDLAVLVEGRATETIENLRDELVDVVSKVAGTGEIDVVVIKNLPVILGYQIAAHCRVLFERNPGQANEVRRQLWNAYFDFLPVIERFALRDIQAVKEGRIGLKARSAR